MRNARIAGQALSLATDSARHPYVCRACLAQATRQLSTSSARNAAQEPFYKRIQKSLFGNKEDKAAEERREAARQKQLEELKAQGPNREKTKIETRRGVVYEVAERVDPITHNDYIVATDARGLARVGGEAWVKKRADQGEVYTGFMPQQQVRLENEEWATLLHTVAVEVMTLREAGRDMLQVCNPRTLGPENESHTQGVLVTNEDGAAKLQYQGAEQQSAILASIPETAQGERALDLELEEALASGSELPSAFPLNDPLVKFAILKRTMQLTGKRVSDISLSRATTLSHLYTAFAKKEQPKKLYETDQLQRLNQAPNIQVHETRRTKAHRDQTIGRWKLIEEELDLRGIPRSRKRRSSAAA